MKREYKLVNTKTGEVKRKETMTEAYRRTRNNSLAMKSGSWRWLEVSDETDR